MTSRAGQPSGLSILRKLRLVGHADSAQRRLVYAAITPMVIFMAIFTLLPIVWAFALAFFDYSPRRAGGPILGLGGSNPFVGLEYFRSMLDFAPDASREVQTFHIGIKMTLLFTALVVPLNLMITLPLAVMIESVHTRLRPLFRTIFFLPVLAPSVGVAIMWGYIYHPQRGLMNAILSQLTGRLVGINWTGDPNLIFVGIPLSLFAVVIAYLWQDMGYNLIIFIAALQSIPEAIKDAARIDGVSSWQMFRYVTLPLLVPTILLAMVFTMVDAFKVFDIIQVMTDGGPNYQTQVLVLNIYNYAFRFQKMGWAAAVSLVLFVMVFVISRFQTRLLRAEWEY